VPDPRILVLGANAAGLKAAARARRLMPRARITVVDQREFISYGACGLPSVLSGEIERLDALRETGYGALRDAAFFRSVKDIDVQTGQRVVAIDRDAKAVTVEAVGDGAHTMIMYDKLVYALGAALRVPAGVEMGPRVTPVTTPEDVIGLRERLQSGRVEKVAVIGGGFVGVETAVALVDMWGAEVTLLEIEDRLLPTMLDLDMARLVTNALGQAGVVVRCGCQVRSARSEGDGAVIELASGPLSVDHVVVAAGVNPRTDLARAAGLAVGERGGLVVDANLRTSDPDILAAGDCIELMNHVSGELCLVPLGSLASRQGRVVGDVLAGRDTEFPAVTGSAAVKVLETNVAATGLSETAARRAGYEPAVAWGAFGDRTHFFPEHERLYLKLVYERDGDRLLGLQAVGRGDAVKRVDVFAALLRQDADLVDLLDVETCYSPPYNAPLDPLQGLAAAALNARETGLGQLPPHAETGGRFVLDVRTATESIASDPPPPGALNIPLEELRQRVDELPSGQPLLIFCAKGPRSFEAARILQDRGFSDIVYLAGGAEMRRAGHLPGPGD
jgi:NADPH-dependent 2,4-dienoyl-CoA reductase/sulfur reductase-like enzyme/rhodanese-related sulfurtransferase